MFLKRWTIVWPFFHQYLLVQCHHSLAFKSIVYVSKHFFYLEMSYLHNGSDMIGFFQKALLKAELMAFRHEIKKSLEIMSFRSVPLPSIFPRINRHGEQLAVVVLFLNTKHWKSFDKFVEILTKQHLQKKKIFFFWRCQISSHCCFILTIQQMISS